MESRFKLKPSRASSSEHNARSSDPNLGWPILRRESRAIELPRGRAAIFIGGVAGRRSGAADSLFLGGSRFIAAPFLCGAPNLAEGPMP